MPGRQRLDFRGFCPAGLLQAISKIENGGLEPPIMPDSENFFF
jgi:hypothetical protein